MVTSRSNPIHVVAGVIRDAHGRVLLGQRGEGRHLAGMWEFPGGKVDAGETPDAALVRELDEELGVIVRHSRPLIAVEHSYPSRRIRLDVHEVLEVEGVPVGREGQPLRWVRPDDMHRIPMPDADRPVVAALRLPPALVITPEPDTIDIFLADFERTLAGGARWVQFRARSMSATTLAELAPRLLALGRRHHARIVINGPPELALDLGLDGVHLDARRLAALSRRPLPAELWVGASCHDRAALEHAAALGLDYATLSPLRRTASHPQVEPLGWERFAALREGVPLPVYALGGMQPQDLDEARRHGAQGVAGIRAFWRSSASSQVSAQDCTIQAGMTRHVP
ncbi:MAG TPA: Nudix family hydrolase [Xanthomonadaceae bacterium]|nr:Nudix family hydrolase [Xanthomonadaceae bacterium]